MDATLNITEEEIYAVKEQLVNGIPTTTEGSGVTVQEIMSANGASKEWVRRRVKRLVEAGKLVVSFRESKNVCGQKCWLPTYSAVENEGDNDCIGIVSEECGENAGKGFGFRPAKH